MAEHEEQVVVVDWFRLQYPQYNGCLFAIPNGASLGGHIGARKKKMDKLKREGFKNGVSDLFLAVPIDDYSGLWVEMKAKGKTKCSLRPEQKDHLDLMQKMGYGAVWCAGAGDAMSKIRVYLGG